jgi:hypothetical protein
MREDGAGENGENGDALHYFFNISSLHRSLHLLHARSAIVRRHTAGINPAARWIGTSQSESRQGRWDMCRDALTCRDARLPKRQAALNGDSSLRMERK